MTSWHGGGGFTSRDGLNPRSHASNAEQVQIRVDKFDFDSEVDSLRQHVGMIKQVAYAIEEERKQQGEIINSMEETMERTKIALKRAMGRLNVAYKQAQSNHILFLVLFAMVLFFTLYVMAKIYRFGSHLFGRG